MVYGYLSICFAGFIMIQMGAFQNTPYMPLDPWTVSTLLKLNLDNITLTVTAAVGGLVTAILVIMKQYTYAGGIFLVFVFGALWTPLSQVVQVVPNILTAVLPAGAVQYAFVGVVEAFTYLTIFLFMAGILAGRDIQ